MPITPMTPEQFAEMTRPKAKAPSKGKGASKTKDQHPVLTDLVGLDVMTPVLWDGLKPADYALTDPKTGDPIIKKSGDQAYDTNALGKDRAEAQKSIESWCITLGYNVIVSAEMFTFAIMIESKGAPAYFGRLTYNNKIYDALSRNGKARSQNETLVAENRVKEIAEFFGYDIFNAVPSYGHSPTEMAAVKAKGSQIMIPMLTDPDQDDSDLDDLAPDSDPADPAEADPVQDDTAPDPDPDPAADSDPAAEAEAEAETDQS